MRYSLATTVEPSVEPITVAEARIHLRVDHDDEDGLIGHLIAAARQQIETATGRRFVTQTLQMQFATFWDWEDGEVRLPVEPVASVTSVKYYDANGTQQTLTANDDYRVWLAHSPPLVYCDPGTYWPTPQEGRPDAVEIVFVAGYGNAGAVPAEVKAAIYVAVDYWFENRGGGRDPAEMGLPPGAVRLIRSLSTGSYS